GEQEYRVEREQDHGQPPLAGTGRDPVDAYEGGEPEHRAKCLEGGQLVPSENAEDGGAQHVISRQPGVLHPEERVVQMSGLGEVGGDEPVAVTVLERLRHLRREQKENSAPPEQSEGGRESPNARQRASAEPP